MSNQKVKLIVELDITHLAELAAEPDCPRDSELTALCALALQHVAHTLERQGVTGFYQNVPGIGGVGERLGTVAVKAIDPDTLDTNGIPALLNGPTSKPTFN